MLDEPPSPMSRCADCHVIGRNSICNAWAVARKERKLCLTDAAGRLERCTFERERTMTSKGRNGRKVRSLDIIATCIFT